MENTYNRPAAPPQSRIILVQEEPRGASQLIEVPVVANGLNRVAFPDIQQLRSTAQEMVVIKAIRLITATVLTNAPLSGNVNAPLTELQKLAITIYSEGWERGQLIPVLTLNDVDTEGSGIPFRYNPTKLDAWKAVDWAKSYLQYANQTVSAGAIYSVLFDVEYIKTNAFGVPIASAS